MFQGFTVETQDFLWGLRLHNDRSWFVPNKELFEQVVKIPMQELAEDTLAIMQKNFDEDDFQMHLSRIYRDARRLYGRGPYKDHMWFTIQSGTRKQQGPMYWFEISPEGYAYGLGMWAEKALLAEVFRERIKEDPKAFEKIVLQITDPDSLLWGNEYKKKKGDFGPVINPWYNRKNINIGNEGPFGSFTENPQLPNILAAKFSQYIPMYRFMRDVWWETQAKEMER